jgi:hypothetical protein
MRVRWLAFIARTINPRALAAAKSGRGPFSLVRHVGRKSGRVYETPIIVAPVPDGFVAELTYGPRVAWYQNSLAAGGCELVVHGEHFTIDRIEPLDAAAGLRAFGSPRSWILRLLRRHEFLTLHIAEG